ncbi:Hypothetical predicted protein [Cloeon dipterum]|uniref:Uncharacterized protein n=1 Tax=Cloeon dipterum TaxID=197152 RepID=A0A8S1CI58_9INSE|nr:Hypothetical predicted protein [Cloeon dipterum]
MRLTATVIALFGRLTIKKLDRYRVSGQRGSSADRDENEGEAEGESSRAGPGRNDRDLASMRVTSADDDGSDVDDPPSN